MPVCGNIMLTLNRLLMFSRKLDIFTSNFRKESNSMITCDRFIFRALFRFHQNFIFLDGRLIFHVHGGLGAVAAEHNERTNKWTVCVICRMMAIIIFFFFFVIFLFVHPDSGSHNRAHTSCILFKLNFYKFCHLLCFSRTLNMKCHCAAVRHRSVLSRMEQKTL